MNKTAFVFAGQGAQTVGMGHDLYEQFDSVKKVYDICGETRDLCFKGPKEQLDITVYTQPAVFLTGLACAQALSEKGIKADGTAGFSLGEVTAACFAGLMDTRQAFDFVKYRAKSMHDCSISSKGTMFAVLKLSNDKVEEVCNSLLEAYPVNYNSPGQVVVACAETTSEKLQQVVAENGGKAIKLAVSGAFHSPFMNGACRDVAEYLKNEKLGTLTQPLYSNTIAIEYDSSDINQKELLAKQINHPVLWQKQVETMISDGFNTFIEVGPGKTLTGLINKISTEVKTYYVSDIPSLENTIENLLRR